MKAARATFLIAALVCAAPQLAQAEPPTPPVYDLRVELEPARQRLRVTGTIRLAPDPNRKTDHTLQLSSLMRDFKVRVVEPRVSAGEATLVKDESGAPKVLWRIIPQQPFPPDSAVTLNVSYEGGEGGGFGFSLGHEGSFAVGILTPWYPQLPGTGTWVPRRGTGSIRFSVPPDHTVIASGIRSSSQSFTFSKPSFFTFAAGKYTHVQKPGHRVSAYVLTPRASTDTLLSGAAEILKTLTEEFGEYPYGEFAIVETPAEASRRARFNGVSAEGMILSSATLMDSPFNRAFYAHEISHQWWGVLVNPIGSPGDVLLSEAMAQYGSLRAVEKIEGGAVAGRFRREGYPGFSRDQSASGYFKMAAAGLDTPLERVASDALGNQLGWNKAFIVYDMLSREFGRAQFSNVLTKLARTYAFDTMRWEDFTAAVRAAFGPKVDAFFAQWFATSGAPTFTLRWQRDKGSVSGTITQPAPFFRGTLQIRAAGDGCPPTGKPVTADGAVTEFSWPETCDVSDLQLDPDYHVLRWTKEITAEATAMLTITRAEFERRAGRLPEARKLYEEATKSAPVPDLYAIGYLGEFGLGRLAFLDKRMEDAKKHLNAALMSPGRPTDGVASAYFELARVAKALGDGALLRFAVDGVVTSEAIARTSGLTGPARALLND
jgi:hypothetical protein